MIYLKNISGNYAKMEEINPITLPWNILQENKQINNTMSELEEILAELL